MFAKSHEIIESHEIDNLCRWIIHFILISGRSLSQSFIFIGYGIKRPVNFFYFHFIVIPLKWQI